MKALICGSNGQLGEALTSSVPAAFECVSVDLPDLDITNLEAVRALCKQSKPNVIINAAAFTAVDNAESQTELATAVNVTGPGNVALMANEIGARIIHISTDFVFDGAASTPYEPYAATNPLNVYGRTKRDGERAVLEACENAAAIVRTAWLYSATGGNFVKTMLRLMSEREVLSVVADQRGTPTWAGSLAEAVWVMAARDNLSGIFHWTDSGEASWHEFAVAIQEEALSLGLLQKAISILPITTADYPTPAARPKYSVLDCASTRAALDLYPAEWRVNLYQMLKGMKA